MKDYYSILGVARTATDDEIKRAFRRLASQHHPDKGGDTEKFQEIQEAYGVLGDNQKRAEYDNPARRVHVNMGPGGFNIDDIFNMFGVNMHQRQMNPRMTLWVQLADAARGGPRAVSLQINNSVTTVQIEIPSGINDGDTIRYPRLAPDGQDLIVTFRIHPDPRWERNGRDITTEIRVDVWDLILGADIPIVDLIGATLVLTVPPRTQPGAVLRLRGRGMPPSTLPGRAGGPPGDLFVRVQARLPDKISEDLLSVIRKERDH